MIKLLNIFILCFCVTIGIVSNAQVSLEGISTGRYEVRSRKARKPASQTGTNVTPAAVSEKPLEKSPDKSTAEPTLTEQAQGLFSEKTEKIYQYYQDQLESEDPRNNRVELDVQPVFAYNDSSSNYAYRNYNTYFNGLQLKANVWFMPMIGVTGKMMFSLAADMDGMTANKSRVPVKYELMDVGLSFRRLFGATTESKSIEVSLLYSENKILPTHDNQTRARLKSQGIGVGLRVRMPSSPDYAWVVGGSFFPRLQHSETEPAVDVGSGANDENIRLGLEVGGEWILGRSSQITWMLSGSAERNIFSGAAKHVDPGTGSIPNNVGITNSLYLFSLGYRWGH